VGGHALCEYAPVSSKKRKEALLALLMYNADAAVAFDVSCFSCFFLRFHFFFCACEKQEKLKKAAKSSQKHK
jgi:hypothetical protein